MEVGCPIVVCHETVQSNWIDYNGHMNVAYYLMIADRGMEAFCSYIGIGEAYKRETNKSTFALDTRCVYLREVLVNTRIRVSAQLIEYDQKKFHVSLELTHDEENWCSAISEWVLVHVDLATRKSEPLPQYVTTTLQEIMDAHNSLPRHKVLERPFGLGKI